MHPVAQQIPVVQQPKTIIRVATHLAGIAPAGAVGGRLARPAVKRDLNPPRVARPARDDTDAALEGIRLGVLQRLLRPPARDGDERQEEQHSNTEHAIVRHNVIFSLV